MRVSNSVKCERFPCSDVRHESYIIPDIGINPEKVSIVLISEAVPANPGDYYYAKGNPLFAQTTVQAFKDAGADVASVEDIINLGVYFTTATKCGKMEYGIKAGTIKQCSLLLEQELALFHKVKAYLLMGDVAIKAVNYIAERSGGNKVIPAGSTYKIRGQEYFFKGSRAFPSYL